MQRCLQDSHSQFHSLDWIKWILLLLFVTTKREEYNYMVFSPFSGNTSTRFLTKSVLWLLDITSSGQSNFEGCNDYYSLLTGPERIVFQIYVCIFEKSKPDNLTTKTKDENLLIDSQSLVSLQLPTAYSDFADFISMILPLQPHLGVIHCFLRTPVRNRNTPKYHR